MYTAFHVYGLSVLFSITGYLGIAFVLSLVKCFGALLAVTGMHFDTFFDKWRDEVREGNEWSEKMK